MNTQKVPEAVNKLRSECLRAIDLINQSQLELFKYGDLYSPETLRARIDSVFKQPDSQLSTQLEAVRTLLRDVLDQYGDPFANYIDPVRHSSYKRRRQGSLVGIGLKFRAHAEALPLVIGVLLGGPLEGADIRPGDRISSVDGIDLQGASSRQVSDALSGEVGTSVTLSILAGSTRQRRQLSIRRQAVELHYARAEILDNSMARLKISRFGGNTHNRVQQLIVSLRQDGVNALVLDLRDNPGGSTRAARFIMSMFDDSEWVFCEQYKNGKSNRLPRAGKKLTNMPLAILVNENSMSSSEILAGALQSSGRATVIGAPTYGKGLIQKVFPLAQPLGGAVRCTIATWATLDEIPLHGRGLIPDIYVPSAPRHLFRETGSLNISAESRTYRRELLEQGFHDSLPAQEAEVLIALPDRQLQRAISHLAV
ncbi:MAG: S41 family peptidase [Granulosicoccus sp.]